MIRISSKRKQGFRRCGVNFGPAPEEFADDRFTAEELDVLQAEPMLRVEIVEASTDEPDAGGDTDEDANEDAGGDADKKPDTDTTDAADADQALVMAAQQAMEDGSVTASGKPTVEAMEAILGYDITAADRDRAYAILMGRE